MFTKWSDGNKETIQQSMFQTFKIILSKIIFYIEELNHMHRLWIPVKIYLYRKHDQTISSTQLKRLQTALIAMGAIQDNL